MTDSSHADARFHPDTSWSSGAERYRYASERDLASFGAMLSDDEVGRWLWFAPISVEAAIAYFRPLLDQQQQSLGRGEPSDALVFTVTAADSGDFLGQGAIVAVSGSERGFEIGFQLCRRAWGRGVGTRLSQFLRTFAIEGLDAYRLEGACLAGNEASARLLRKLGLRQEATLVDYRLRDGVRHTELRFGARVRDLT